MKSKKYKPTHRVRLTRYIFWDLWIYKKGQILNVTEQESDFLVSRKMANPL